MEEQHRPQKQEGDDKNNSNNIDGVYDGDTDNLIPDATAPPFNPDSASLRAPHGILTRIMKFDMLLTIALDLAFFMMVCVVTDRVRTAATHSGLVTACVALSITTCVINVARVVYAIFVIMAASRIRRGWPFWMMYNIYYFWLLVLCLLVFAVAIMSAAAISKNPAFKDIMIVVTVMNFVFRLLVLLIFILVPLCYTKWSRRLWRVLSRKAYDTDESLT